MDRDESSDIAAQWDAAMRRGDFEAAWRQTDRIEIPRRAAASSSRLPRAAHQLRWNGEPFANREVLVWCEHGLGDTLQFARFVPLIRSVARRVYVLVQPALVELLRLSDRFGEVRNGWSGEPPPHDVEVEVMELGYAFRTTSETLPRDVPYLPAAALRSLAASLPPMAAGEALRVGIAWGASDWDDTRSVAVESLAPLAAIPGVRLYSLQQGRQRDTPTSFPLEPYSRHTEAVELAAGAMLGLDLVITVDSMVAHLAGALGRPVWVLLKAHADWRWMEGREDSPWYPTMRLFRQTREGDWNGVIERVAVELRQLAVG